MNANLHPIFEQALAPFVTPVNPFRRATGTSAISRSLQDWNMPNHHDLSSVLFDLAAAVRQNGSLTEKCRVSVNDALLEMADSVDHDLVNQQAEQTWIDHGSKS